MNSSIHYVPLDEFPLEPRALSAACGEWCAGTDWTTQGAIVSCPECRVLLTGLALLRRASAAEHDDQRKPRSFHQTFAAAS